VIKVKLVCREAIQANYAANTLKFYKNHNRVCCSDMIECDSNQVTPSSNNLGAFISNPLKLTKSELGSFPLTFKDLLALS
jgi:hypothetical protein